MKYQVWVKAHDPKTLAVIAEVLVFEHEIRLEAEKLAEIPRADEMLLFGPFVLHQGRCSAPKPGSRVGARLLYWHPHLSSNAANVRRWLKHPFPAAAVETAIDLCDILNSSPVFGF